MGKITLNIDFEPLGRRIDISGTESILDAARHLGLDMTAICGGSGTCGSCKIRLAAGQLSPLTENEKRRIAPASLEQGYRLACRSYPVTDCRIEIPPESLSAIQRTQVDGLELSLEAFPSVVIISPSFRPPHNSDLLADDRRIQKALEDVGFVSPVRIEQPMLACLSTVLRQLDWNVKLVVSKGIPSRLVGCLPASARVMGIACDMGSTKLALYLVDLESGKILDRTGCMNPQISYGEDVVNRIAYSNTHKEGQHVLQHRLIETINEMIDELCRRTNTSPDWIVDCVMVGNTAMHHFFGGFPVRQLGEAPFIPAVSEAVDLDAAGLGLHTSAGSRVFMPPNIAGFVGADHIAMLLAGEGWQGDKNILSMDIGTNTEISLLAKGNLFSCSCASGPAFEGAHIQAGMRAAAGAIERLQIQDGKIIWQTIDGKPPIGICGSGILDAVAEMKKAGIIDERGVYDQKSPYLTAMDGRNKFVLVPTAQTGHGKDIAVTRSDINQVQLAKAAIQAGVKVLLGDAGICIEEIDSFIMAGAFGTYLDIENSIEIGLLPDLPAERFHQIGNAAGVGACQLLLSERQRQDAELIASKSKYIELTIHPEFTERYFEAMYIKRGYGGVPLSVSSQA
jgi:uncharacterized 2Fe-2S/4Fe-4S cluster protein (DUF4445 family)